MQNKQEQPEPTQDQHPEQPPRSNPILRFTSMATQMAITIFLGVWGGMKLDQKFPHRITIFTLVLSLLGVVVAIYMVIKDFVKKK